MTTPMIDPEKVIVLDGYDRYPYIRDYAPNASWADPPREFETQLRSDVGTRYEPVRYASRGLASALMAMGRVLETGFPMPDLYPSRGSGGRSEARRKAALSRIAKRKAKRRRRR